MDIENFYAVYTNINKLLYNRGYFKDPRADENLSREFIRAPEELWKIPRSELTIKTKSRPDAKIHRPDMIVFFSDEDKIGIKPIRAYKIEMTEYNIHNAIVVVKNGITPYVKTNMQIEIKEPYNIEIFMENELLIDKTEHILVPKHEVLSQEERREFLDMYKMSNAQKIPPILKILSSDPIARYYGVKTGDIFRISRLSETAGIYVNYRVVV
jgi:DNA-directed RNA polymerase I, II, and III subunit RPABC1